MNDVTGSVCAKGLGDVSSGEFSTFETTTCGTDEGIEILADF